MNTPPKPSRKKAADLAHPKADTYVAWNGDIRKKGSTRWNGQPDLEDRGFDSRRAEKGLTITDGTTAHETKVWNTAAGDVINLQGSPVHQNCGVIQPRPAGNTFDPSFRPADRLPTNNAPTKHSVVRKGRRVTTNDS